jgi:hypothetical protein
MSGQRRKSKRPPKTDIMIGEASIKSIATRQGDFNSKIGASLSVHAAGVDKAPEPTSVGWVGYGALDVSRCHS